MRRLFTYTKDIVSGRYLLSQLVKRNILDKYKRSKLGIFWAVGEPLAFMFILNLVFGIGLRGGRNMGIPFITYLVSGLAVITFFSQAAIQGTNSIRTHSYLLKKVNFRMSLLPLVTVAASVVDHLIFFFTAVIIILIQGIVPNWYWIQILYYIFALSMLLIGITFFSSAVGVFFPDLQQIMGIITRMLFYFSPIFWDYEMLSEGLQRIVKWNPLFYIIEGYRNSLFFEVPFWEHTELVVFYWVVVVVFLLIGIFTFRKLRPQFSDSI